MTKKEALELLKHADEKELFKKAGSLRDEKLGKKLWFSSVASGILPCLVEPKCSYCSYYREERYERELLIKGVLKAKSLGFEQFHISGGTDLKKGFDEEILKLLKDLREKSDIKLEFNFGPSFKNDSVIEFKKLGLNSLTSSLECINPLLFKALKPGDDLARRKGLLELCDQIALPTRTVMLVGLGESDEDIIDHLFYLQARPSLYQLTISKFRPFKNTALAKHKACSSEKVARITAVARLLLKDIELSIPWGNNAFDLPLWYAAGGGGQVMGMKLAKIRPKDEAATNIHTINHEGNSIYAIDQRPMVREIAKAFGVEVTQKTPLALRGF